MKEGVHDSTNFPSPAGREARVRAKLFARRALTSILSQRERK
jgi:hypothetical protein